MIYTKNETKPVTPASNEKLLTAVAALDVLGGDTRLRTSIVSDARTNGRSHQRITLGGRRGRPAAVHHGVHRSLRRALRVPPRVHRHRRRRPPASVAAGITEIKGDVIGDDRRYDRERSVPSWPGRLIAQGQVGPLSALVVNDGFTVVRPRSRGDDIERVRRRSAAARGGDARARAPRCGTCASAASAVPARRPPPRRRSHRSIHRPCARSWPSC